MRSYAKHVAFTGAAAALAFGAYRVTHGEMSLQALLIKAGLPESTFAAFQVAIDVGQEMGFAESDGAAARLRRRSIALVAGAR